MQQARWSGLRSHRGTLETAVLLGAAALVAWPAAKSIAQRWRMRHPKATCEPAIDKSLKDTYPASDPPAQRFVDIPINRR